MRLPLPDPRGVLVHGAALAGEAASLLPRAFALLDGAEDVLRRADALIDRIENTRQSADKVIVSTAGTVASVQPTLERAQRLVDTFAPILETLQPTLARLASTTSPEEVEAVVRLVDHLPMLVERLENDVLPILENMDNVGDDIHDLLDTAHEINEMLAKVPGMGRIRQRVQDKQAEED